MGFDVEVASSWAPDALGMPVINASGVDDRQLWESTSLREVASRMSRWVDNARAAGRKTSMFDRGTFTPPDNPFDEMRAARYALGHDDVVGGVAEITESFAFQGVKWEGDNPDDADIFNQISADIDLDSLLRKMWRDVYTYSQCPLGMTWGWKTYTVRGKTEGGNRRKKRYRVWVPVDVRTLPSTKIVPVGGSGPYCGDYLAWCATLDETDRWDRAFRGELIDPLMVAYFRGPYTPVTRKEEEELEALGVDVSNLLMMNPDMVWRHTLTRPDYERFADVRLKNVFPQLDLKRQLINSDRAMLIGAANYILLIRKGDEKMPAKEPELRNLKENYNFIAKLPVVISDHRLSMEIIAPSQDFTLQSERYDVLDTRILMRLLNTLSLGARGQRNETSITLGHAVGRGMENRRHMIARSFERNFARAIVRHPRNQGMFDPVEPSMVFVPRNIALETDPEVLKALQNLRDKKEISRETILEHFGLDQKTESQRREIEEDLYDDIFKTSVPFDSPEHEAPAQSGARGGRPTGGGSPTNNATKARGSTAAGNTPKGDA